MEDRRIAMITLCIRYTFNPEKLADFRAYVKAEQGPIQRTGGRILGYFLPTDFAGPTNEAIGLIDLPSLAPTSNTARYWRTTRNIGETSHGCRKAVPVLR
jgi:NIPSNAP